MLNDGIRNLSLLIHWLIVITISTGYRGRSYRCCYCCCFPRHWNGKYSMHVLTSSFILSCFNWYDLICYYNFSLIVSRPRTSFPIILRLFTYLFTFTFLHTHIPSIILFLLFFSQFYSSFRLLQNLKYPNQITVTSHSADSYSTTLGISGQLA